MAFWGVEVKPGKPYAHVHDNHRRPLRLSQATLGNGEAIKRSVLQCNVGSKAPVILCSLLPNRVESSGLDLQFEESDVVVFSVVGPRSIHLAGYFISGTCRRGGLDANDSDSYGEDIWNMGSEDSSIHTSEDKYESDFIDDSDVEMSASPLRRDSGKAVIEEIEDEEPRCLRKKHQVFDSDEDELAFQPQLVASHHNVPSSESDEDGFPISFSVGKKKEKNFEGEGKLSNDKMDINMKRNLNIVDKDYESERKDKAVAVNQKSKTAKKDRIKSEKSFETNHGVLDKHLSGNQVGDLDKHANDRMTELQPYSRKKVGNLQGVVKIETSGKKKKKKAAKVKMEEAPETSVEFEVQQFVEATCMGKIDTQERIEQVHTENNNEDHLAETGHQSVHDPQVVDLFDKLKRKKKRIQGEASFDGQKDGKHKSHDAEVVKGEAYLSNQKMDSGHPSSVPPPEMGGNVSKVPFPAEIHHESSKKKHKWNRGGNVGEVPVPAELHHESSKKKHKKMNR